MQENIEKNIKLSELLETSKNEAFLQSEEWQKFQEIVGRHTFQISGTCNPKNKEECFFVWASTIEHTLPLVGKYFYIPRGPIMIGKNVKNILRVSDVKQSLDYLFWLARDNDAGWIRFDALSEKDLALMEEAFKKVKVSQKTREISMLKAPHDVQPKEIFVIDVSKNEEELLSEMKSKTRYNIRLSEKKGVKIVEKKSREEKKKFIEEFLKLNRETAQRDGIVTHSDEYYRKMVETLPEEMISLYVAEYKGKILAANLVIFFGDTATYVHGTSSNENRDVMAPYLLQWKQIQDAKERGCKFYDFGGVKTMKHSDLTPTLSSSRRGSKGEVDSWSGITRFKTGFSTKTESVVFPGSYDIIINPRKYSIYKGLQKAKKFLSRIRK